MTNLVSAKKISGIGPRLLGVADRVAPLAGTLQGVAQPFFAKGGQSAEGAVGVVTSSIKGFRFANPISTTLSALRQPGVYPIIGGAKTWLAGLIASEAGDQIGGVMGDLFKTAGSAGMKFGTSASASALVVSYFLEQGGGGGGGLLDNVGNNAFGSNFGTSGRMGRRQLAQDNPERDARTQPRSGMVTRTVTGTREF